MRDGVEINTYGQFFFLLKQPEGEFFSISKGERETRQATILEDTTKSHAQKIQKEETIKRNQRVCQHLKNRITGSNGPGNIGKSSSMWLSSENYATT